MGIGFKPDNSPKEPYNHGKEGRVVVGGFRSDQIEKENKDKIITYFMNFCGQIIKENDYKNQIFQEAKRIMTEEKIDGKELMSSIENKFANDLIDHIKNKPEIIFSELQEEKTTLNKFFELGINREKFSSLIEAELIALFVNQAKMISKDKDKVDTTNPQIIKGIKNILDLGAKKEHLTDAINHR